MLVLLMFVILTLIQTFQQAKRSQATLLPVKEPGEK